MKEKWLIVGISGATCSGKTTLANKLSNIFPGCRVINQDNYFLPVHDDRHVWMPELNHINFDILTSLDMDKMYGDVKGIVSDSLCRIVPSLSDHFRVRSELPPLISRENLTRRLSEKNLKILIVEGFCIFHHKPIESLCNLKYFLTLNKEECHKRRMKRVYEPPNCPGYFEHCAWPEYLRQLEDITKNMENVHFLSEFSEDPIEIVLQDVKRIIDCSLG